MTGRCLLLYPHPRGLTWCACFAEKKESLSISQKEELVDFYSKHSPDSVKLVDGLSAGYDMFAIVKVIVCDIEQCVEEC
jgi:hypothetical protein